MLDVVASNSGIFLVADPGFPRGGCANSSRGGGVANIRFCQNSPKDCMKLQKFGPRGVSLMLPLDPPLILIPLFRVPVHSLKCTSL